MKYGIIIDIKIDSIISSLSCPLDLEIFFSLLTSDLLQGMTLVTGGLDVLETIGKTTYDVLAEGDTGLKAILMKARDKPDLSKVSVRFVAIVVLIKSVLLKVNETSVKTYLDNYFFYTSTLIFYH